MKVAVEPGRSLADDLQMVNDPGPNQLVVLKGAAAPGGVSLNAFNRVQHVQ